MQSAYGSLRGAQTVNDPEATNLIQVILHGSAIQTPEGRLAMPAFGAAFTHSQVAALANYVLQHFRRQAPERDARARGEGAPARRMSVGSRCADRWTSKQIKGLNSPPIASLSVPIATPFPGRKVIIASEEQFVTRYVASVLRAAGLQVVGPVASLAEVVRLAAEEPQPAFACLSVNLPGLDRSAEAMLREHAIRYALFGVPATIDAWGAAAFLWPFAGYQMVEHIANAWTEAGKA